MEKLREYVEGELRFISYLLESYRGRSLDDLEYGRIAGYVYAFNILKNILRMIDDEMYKDKMGRE